VFSCDYIFHQTDRLRSYKREQRQFDDKYDRAKLSSKVQEFYLFFRLEKQLVIRDLFKKILLLSSIQIFCFYH